MKVKGAILTLAVWAVSCSSPVNLDLEILEKSDTLPLPVDSTTLYFPSIEPGADIGANAVRAYANPYFSRILFILNEPVLKDYRGQKEVYRFSWLRSFSQPVVIRVEKHVENIRLYAKVSIGNSGYDPGKIRFDTAIIVRQEHIDTINSRLSSAGFWSLGAQSQNEIGLDGAEWIVEVYKDNRYHVVARWMPLKGNSFRQIGEYFISISGIRNETDGIDDY